MEKEFEYGPIAQGVFIALICSTPLMLFIAPKYLPHYVFFLLLLGLGLRPLLIKTGLHRFWSASGAELQGGMDRKFIAKRRADIELQDKLKRYRKSRYRDPRLPKNW